MKHNTDKLANSVWISRFWAQYSKLPEVLKNGFYSLVLSITKEAKNECSDQWIEDGNRLPGDGNCRV